MDAGSNVADDYDAVQAALIRDKFAQSIVALQRLGTLSTICAAVLAIWLLGSIFGRGRTSLPLANRLFPFEPSIFARFRWSIWAQDILDVADKKAAGQPYRLARGDKELIVLPWTFISGLNRLGTDVLDSRQSHAFAFLSHLTGLQRTVKASYQTRILQRRITPAAADLFYPMADRILTSIRQNFLVGDDWTRVKPLDPATICFSQGMCFVLFGAKLAKSSRLNILASTLAEDVGKVAFTMRLVPSILQPLLVWLLPAKWRLDAKWAELEMLLAPEVHRQKGIGKANTGVDLLSWMIRDATADSEKDPSVLTTLCGSVAQASINSVANLVCNMIADLAAHPEVLDEVRSEIRTRHAQIGGSWDMTCLIGLDKLESAMKETARLASSPLIVYSRVVQRDTVLNGLELRQGQFITMSGRARTMDPAIFENPECYQGLRFCKDDSIAEHRIRTFATVDTDILTWGAGRSACPGRLIADLAAKAFLIPLIDAYDFAVVDDKPLRRGIFHEFLFFRPDSNLLMRRRKDAVHINIHPPKSFEERRMD